MPRYGMSVSFEYSAQNDEHAEEVLDNVTASIGSHPLVYSRSVNRIDPWPECVQDCDEEESDDQSEEG